jgi:hypothetical protein
MRWVKDDGEGSSIGEDMEIKGGKNGGQHETERDGYGRI